MTDSAAFELDMRAFCAEVMREYEEVIETLIERPSIASSSTEEVSGAGRTPPGLSVSSERG